MTFNQSNLLSGRVPVTGYANLTSDRYQFLSVDQAEPNLGPGANGTILTITTNNTRVWSNSFSVTGNIGGNYVFGNGAFLTGVTGSGNSVVSNQTISGDGSTVAYTLDLASTNNGVFVTTNGVAQAPGVDYTVAGTTITFTTPPAIGDVMQIRFLTNNLVTVTTTYNDANVAAFLPTYSGVVTASGISTTGNITTGALTQNRVYTVSTLPVASDAGAGARAFVNNANTTTFYSVAGGGGSNTVPVFSDGTEWRVG